MYTNRIRLYTVGRLQARDFKWCCGIFKHMCCIEIRDSVLSIEQYKTSHFPKHPYTHPLYIQSLMVVCWFGYTDILLFPVEFFFSFSFFFVFLSNQKKQPILKGLLWKKASGEWARGKFTTHPKKKSEILSNIVYIKKCTIYAFAVFKETKSWHV